MLLSKKNIRRYCKEMWNLFFIDKSNIDSIIQNLMNFFKIKFPEENQIFSYYPTENELPILDILEKQFRIIFLPVIEDYSLYLMNFYLYKNENDFVKLFKNKYGIWEPEKKEIGYPQSSLILLPSLGANKNFVRLGRGKGYYDRYFYKNSNHNNIIITLLPEQLTNLDFLEEPHDLVLDYIITEKNIYKRKQYEQYK